MHPTFDYTVNVPTLLAICAVALKIWSYLARMTYKINTMWAQFLIEHPEYERREAIRLGRLG